MAELTNEQKTCKNTDRELWREAPGDYYANSIHVTEKGGIGIDVGGTVIVKPLSEWHALGEGEKSMSNLERRVQRLEYIVGTLITWLQFNGLRASEAAQLINWMNGPLADLPNFSGPTYLPPEPKTGSVERRTKGGSKP